MDKALCRTLAAEAKIALDAIASAHGLTVKVGGGSYDAGTFRPKVVFEQADAAKLEFETYAESFGLRPEDFGAEFTIGPRTYRIVGIAPRSRRFGVIALNLGDNKRYKLPETTVAMSLRRH